MAVIDLWAAAKPWRGEKCCVVDRSHLPARLWTAHRCYVSLDGGQSQYVGEFKVCYENGGNAVCNMS